MGGPRPEPDDLTMEPTTARPHLQARRRWPAEWFAGASIALVVFGLLTRMASFDMVSTVIGPFYAMGLALLSLWRAHQQRTPRWLPIAAIVFAVIGIADAALLVVQFIVAMNHMGF
jgi:hypothetical protein